MPLTARDLMSTQLRTIDPEMSLPDLERAIINDRLTGFPVVEDGRLVGIVGRTDIMRQLTVEQTLAEVMSDFYRDGFGDVADQQATLTRIGEQVGGRMEHLRVKDVMVRNVLTVAPTQTLAEVARTLVDNNIHRVPVVDGDKLVGIITITDLVRLYVDGRIRVVE